VNKGGIFAVAHVRGGGEKGDNWYKGGFKSTKPNTWKDFIACTEYLIENKYTSPTKMVSYSGSAGGICVGRAMTERPDLYAACIVKVGEFNTLRSEFGASGKNNIKEFGTIKDSIDFRALLEMDSYYHIKKGTNYPAVYLTSGLNDTRVSTWQPAKFAARLLENTSSKKPILLSVDFESGHGFEADNDKKNEELNKIITFALWQTGHPDYQFKKK
jgi:prolyl oligopeptidase